MAFPAGITRPFLRGTRPLYWATQLIGWALYLGLFMLWNYLSVGHSEGFERLMLLVYIVGIMTSHVFRHLILRHGLTEQGIGQVLPRLALYALLLGVVAYFMHALLHDLMLRDFKPLLSLPALEQVSRMINWTVLLLLWSMAYLGYIYFIRHRREEIRILRLETANRENQLNNLRAQLNPHFMFNALNGIRALIDEDPEQAKRAITQLSAILRNAMATVKRRVVPLGEEIDIVKAYLALEAMRYEERLRTRFDVEPGLEREPVPPMMLQTLVENAVRHGVATIPGGGDLVISARRTPEHLLLRVMNSGHYAPGKADGDATPRNGIGLRNTRKRLEMIYGDKARIEIRNAEGMVLTEVQLPLGTTA